MLDGPTVLAATIQATAPVVTIEQPLDGRGNDLSIVSADVQLRGAIVNVAALIIDGAGVAAASSSIGGTSSLVKLGAGTLEIQGVHTYNGATTISEGTLVVNGLLTSTPHITVQSGAQLSGSGEIGGVVIVEPGGTYSPGQSPGTLTADGLELSALSTFVVEINGLTAGTEFDQTVVRGPVSLGGAALGLSFGTAPPVNRSFLLIDNDGSDPVVGEFALLADDVPFIHSGRRMSIDYNGGDGNDVLLHILAADLVGRRLFYNNSSLDNHDPAANAADDQAMASDKAAFISGAASFTHYSSYAKGINGVMIDVRNLADAGALSASDFGFRAGNTSDPSAWPTVQAAASISVRPGAGNGGSDRITITWPDHAIRNTWLQVTVLATVNTGLAAPDVFYFGNAVGESGDANSHAFVNGFDFAGVRDNLTAMAGVTNRFDYNRDGVVDGADLAVVRDNLTHFANAIRLLSIPGPPPLAMLQRAADERTEVSEGEDRPLPVDARRYELLRAVRTASSFPMIPASKTGSPSNATDFSPVDSVFAGFVDLEKL